VTAPSAFWGPGFPDYGHAGGCFWGPGFPDCFQDPTVVGASGPATAATFVFRLADLKIRMSWATDVFKAYSGVEQRRQPDDLPRQTLSGRAWVQYSDLLVSRGALARYAAQNKPFLLGLPHEALPLTGATSGAVVPVPTTTYIDWAVAGQRAIVTDGTTNVLGVVQSAAGASITLDVSPALARGYIMPAVPVFLDAQLGFTRYQKIGSLESWQISGREQQFGYESGSSIPAVKALSGVTGGYLTGMIAVFRTPGTIGNGSSLQLQAGSALNQGTLIVTGTNAYLFQFKNGVTQILDLLTALAASNLYLIGAFSGPITSTLRTGADEFGPATLTGGVDKNWGTMGNGATVTTYLSRPVWDRGLEVGDSDSIHSMTELLDLGGVPALFQAAAVPDWGRAVRKSDMDIREWQWLKAFQVAVRGRQRAFWLPTMRADLSPVSLDPGTLVVSSTIGDLLAWYPTLRQQLRVELADGSVQYIQITAYVDNGNGTYSLTITSSNTAYNPAGGGAHVAAAGINLVSWLDLCRWESDDFEVQFASDTEFSFAAQARAVQL
jgi:hypothetical protein